MEWEKKFVMLGGTPMAETDPTDDEELFPVIQTDIPELLTEVCLARKPKNMFTECGSISGHHKEIGTVAGKKQTWFDRRRSRDSYYRGPQYRNCFKMARALIQKLFESLCGTVGAIKSAV